MQRDLNSPHPRTLIWSSGLSQELKKWKLPLSVFCTIFVIFCVCVCPETYSYFCLLGIVAREEFLLGRWVRAVGSRNPCYEKRWWQFSLDSTNRLRGKANKLFFQHNPFAQHTPIISYFEVFWWNTKIQTSDWQNMMISSQF